MQANFINALHSEASISSWLLMKGSRFKYTSAKDLERVATGGSSFGDEVALPE